MAGVHRRQPIMSPTTVWRVTSAGKNVSVPTLLYTKFWVIASTELFSALSDRLIRVLLTFSFIAFLTFALINGICGFRSQRDWFGSNVSENTFAFSLPKWLRLKKCMQHLTEEDSDAYATSTSIKYTSICSVKSDWNTTSFLFLTRRHRSGNCNLEVCHPC